MTRIPDHDRRRIQRICARGAPQAAAFVVALIVLAATDPASAVDGMLEGSSSHQEGRSGAEAYSSDNRRLRGSIDERFDFSRDLALYLRYGALRETQENRTAFSFVSYTKEVQDPYLAFTYDAGNIEAGIYGNARRTDYFFTSQGNTRDDQINGSAFVFADFRLLDIETRLTEGHSDRYYDGRRVETRDHRLSVSARARVTSRDQLLYEFTRSVNDYLTTGYEAHYRTHRVEYTGNRTFADGRGRASVTARYTHLDQRVSFGGGDDVRYLQPDWGGFVLDDTPEDLDPLEPDPVLVPSLYDTDRDTPTVVNIGDDAPPVREYGGDYRNIIFDFGDLVEISAAFVYVDTILNFPELMRWQVYVSDDPEGSDWGTALGPGIVTWSYEQEANGQQGWSFRFATPVVHRRLKVVNSKLGPTGPGIYVTEFEVYGPGEGDNPDATAVNSRQRLIGNVGYLLAPRLDVSYRGDFWRAKYGDTDRDERSAGHVGEVVWSPGRWRVTGALTANNRTTASGRDTKVYSQRLVVAQKPWTDFDWRVGWNRTDDRSYNRNQVTQNVAGDVNWRAAPGLVVNQKVAYGRRDDAFYDRESTSWVLITNVRSTPRPTIGLDLRRSDRWVSAEAGSGFTTFNDSEVRFAWAIFPQLNYSGILRYHVRERTGDWIRRSSLSLTPLPGGSLSMSFYASFNEDTRAATRQRAVGTRLTWRPRPTLLLEGGYEYSRFTNGPTHSTPSSVNVRGYWTF